jgi:F-type H+-transporting ATPase subunit epsilon
MANTIHVDIVSAEGQIFKGDATMVFAPAAGGEIGIAPRHAPLLTMLKPGEVRVQVEGAALAAKQRAEEGIRGRADQIEIAEAQAELARAVAQLRAIERIRKKR